VPVLVRRVLLAFLLAGGLLLLGAVFADQARAAGADEHGASADPLASVAAEAGQILTAATAEEEAAYAGEPEVAGHLEPLVSGLTETIGLSGLAEQAEDDTVPGEGLEGPEGLVPVPAPPQREPASAPAPDGDGHGAGDQDRPPGPEPRPRPGPVSHPGETGTAGGVASPTPERPASGNADDADAPDHAEPDGAPRPPDPGSRCAVQVGGEQTPRHPDSYAMSEARQPLAVPPGGDRRLRGAAAALRGRPQDSAELPG
jgi:hypothetical protein